MKKHFKEKKGYANYFFNTLEQQRVWKAWNAGTHLDGAAGDWTLTGPLEKGGKYRLEITADGASLQLRSDEPTKWAASDQLSAPPLLPAHSGGLLPALYLWRRLGVEGLKHFGSEIYYFGTAPAGRTRRTRQRVGRDVQGRGMPLLFRPHTGPSVGNRVLSR